MSDERPVMWLIQRDYGHEGHSDIAAIANGDDAEAIVRDLNLREGGGYFVETVPVFADRATARIQQITIRQQVLHGQLGDYQELRETVWAFNRRDPEVTMLGTTSTSIDLTVVGYDQDAVLAVFTEALEAAKERTMRDLAQP